MAGCEQNWDNSFWNKCKLRDCWFGRYESVGLVVTRVLVGLLLECWFGHWNDVLHVVLFYQVLAC